MEGLFVPGWGAPPALYAPALPPGWRVLEPPSFSRSRGSLEPYRRRLAEELERADGPAALAGHSMGGALAISAAAATPERVARLVLVAPAGLPLAKPMTRSLATFGRQLAEGRYPLRLAARAIGGVVASPRSALRVARAVRELDLAEDMERVRAAGIPTTVLGCVGDTLVTVESCRRAAQRLGGRCDELDVPGGHVWMIGEGAPLLRRALS